MATSMPLPDGYNYKHVQINNDGPFEHIFRIDVASKDQAFVWLGKFSFINKSTWRIARTYPNSGRHNAFKLDMRCTHSTKKKVLGIRSSKQTGCCATLQILIKGFHETVKSEKHKLDRDWPTIITIRGTHNHDLDTPEVLKYRDISERSFTKLKEFFQNGHSASSALESLKAELLLEYGDKYAEIATDGFYVPSYSKVHKLFQKEFILENESFSEKNFKCLKEQLEIYTSTSGGTAKFFKTSDSEHYFIVICTPIMQRVHKMIPDTSELVFVDSYGGRNKNQRHRIYVFVTPTAAGGLPLGIIISDSEKEYVFHEALYKLKEIFPNDSLNGDKEPKVFLTNNDLEWEPLKHLFPNSTILLCPFHFLKLLWTWLCEKKHKIDASDRQEIFSNVKKVVHAKTKENAEIYHHEILSSKLSKKYDNFLLYYLHLWENRNEWATCFWQSSLLHGNNSTNLVEIVFHILKDCIFGQIMAFNLGQIVDYILTRYEIYIEKRLKDFSNGRCSKATLKHFLPPFPDVYFLQKEESGNYLVAKKSTKAKYMVDILNGTCTCFKGLSEKVCAHTSFVISNINDEIEIAFNKATKETREVMLYIAVGEKSSSNCDEPLEQNSVVVDNEDMDMDELIGDNEPTFIDHCEVIGENEPTFIDHCEASSSSSISCSSSTVETVSKDTVPTVYAAEKKKFNDLVKRILIGIEKSPEIYVPALKKMIQNYENFASTEIGLITAMNSFGTCNSTSTKNCAIGRRKKCLTKGKKHVR